MGVRVTGTAGWAARAAASAARALDGGPGHVRRLSVGRDGRGCVDRSDEGHGERRLPEGRGAGEEQVGRHPGQDVVGAVEGDDLHRVDAGDLDAEQAQAGMFPPAG